MAGIYIHIPFCRKACHYCNFHFSTSLQKAPEVLISIEKEMEIRSEELKEEINTVYFGGGTQVVVLTRSSMYASKRRYVYFVFVYQSF